MGFEPLGSEEFEVNSEGQVIKGDYNEEDKAHAEEFLKEMGIDCKAEDKMESLIKLSEQLVKPEEGSKRNGGDE